MLTALGNNNYKNNVLHNHESGRYIHRHKFLEKELGGIGKANLRYLCFVLAALAFERVVTQVSDDDKAAQVTYVNAIRI